MKKKFKLLFLVAVLALFVPNVMAAEKTASTDAELVNAFNTAVTGDTIKLTDNIEHTGGKILVGNGKDITLDLNGHSIVNKSEDDRSITIYNGTLTIKGKGTITHDFHQAINVWGFEESSSTKKSVLNVGKDVTLTGLVGVGVFYDVEHGAYNTEVNFAGTIKTSSFGISTNGSILNDNGPVINVKSGANITSENAAGIYNAGNGTVNIEDGTTITGTTGVEIRAGILNVNGGTITGTAKELKTQKNGNGSTSDGAGIAVIQHTTKLPIDVKINKGTIKGVEALFVNDTEENGSEYFSKVKAEVTGGTFSTDVTKYVADKYIAKLVNGQCVVEENKVIESNDKKITFESEKALDNNLELRIDEATKEEKEATDKKVTEKYKDNKDVKDAALISLYDIKVGLQQADEFEVVPMENGKFTISITLEDNAKKYDNYKVIYIDEQGNISETIDAKLVDGKIVFETSHLSVYGIVGYNNATGASINNPNTGDNLSMIIILGGLSLIILSGAALKLKKSN